MKSKWLYLIVGFVLIVLLGGLIHLYTKTSTEYELLMENNGLYIQPVNPTNDYPYYLVYELKPGDTIEDYVRVGNNFDEGFNMTFRTADVVDEYYDDEMAWLLKSAELEHEGVGKWVTTEYNEKYIEAESAEEVKVTISIPEDAEYGEYWGAVLVTPIPNDIVNDGSRSVVLYEIGARTKITVTDDPQELEPYDYSRSTSRINKTIWGKYGVMMGIMTCIALVIIIFLQLGSAKK